MESLSHEQLTFTNHHMEIVMLVKVEVVASLLGAALAFNFVLPLKSWKMSLVLDP